MMKIINVLCLLWPLFVHGHVFGSDTMSKPPTRAQKMGAGAFKASAPGLGVALAGLAVVQTTGNFGVGYGIYTMGLLFGVYKFFKAKDTFEENKKVPLKKLSLGTNTILVYKNKVLSEDRFNSYMSKHAQFLSELLPKLGMHKTVHLFIEEALQEEIAGFSYLNSKAEPCISIGLHTLDYSKLDVEHLWAHECAHLLLGHCAGGPRVGLLHRIKALYNREQFIPYYEHLRAQEMEAELYGAALLGGTQAALAYRSLNSRGAQEAQEKMDKDLVSCSLMYWPWYRVRNKFFPLEHTHPENQEVREELKKLDEQARAFIQAFEK